MTLLGLHNHFDGAHGDIVDPPVIESVNGFVCATSGSNGTNSFLQAETDFSSPSTATLAASSNFDLHALVMNDAYFTSATLGNWLVYEMA